MPDGGHESRPSTNRASTITCGASARAQGSSGLGRQPTEQVRSPSNFTGYASGGFGSRPSTNRASTITVQLHRLRERRLRVSAVNQPSKYDHRPTSPATRAAASGLGRQPTEQVQSRCGSVAPVVSPASRPSTNRASTITLNAGHDDSARVSLGRQPTEQVRSPPAGPLHQLGATQSRPSTNRTSTITFATRRGTRRKTCLGRQPTEQVRSRAAATRSSSSSGSSRPSTNRASTITCSPPRRRAGVVREPVWPSTNRASTITPEEIRRGGIAPRVSAVNQPSKYDHDLLADADVLVS